MDARDNAKENRLHGTDGGAGTNAAENESDRIVSESASPLDTDWDSEWLAEIDDHIVVAADMTVDLRRRLGAVGTAANLGDEVFENRLRESISSPTGKSDERQRRLQLTLAVGSRMDRLGQVLHATLLPELNQRESIDVVKLDSLSDSQRRWLRARFLQQVFPLLTPLAVDSGRPFPRLESGSLTLLTALHSREADQRYDRPVFALIQVPDVLERWLVIGSGDGSSESSGGSNLQVGQWFDAKTYGPGTYIWSEHVVRSQIGLLFPGMSVTGAYFFRVLRSYPDQPHDGGRRPPSRGESLPIVRLDVEESMPLAVRQWLTRHLVVPDQALVRSHPPMAMADLTQVADRLSLRKRGVRGWLQSAVDLFFGHI